LYGIHPRLDAGQLDLWLVDLATGRDLNLTQTPDRNESSPAWWPQMPDVILFRSIRVEDDNPNAPGNLGYLTAVGLDASGYQVLDPDHDTCGFPQPSPDGKTIAYGCGTTGWLYEWGSGTVPFDPVERGLAGIRDPLIYKAEWSADGRMLAWSVNPGSLKLDDWTPNVVAIFDLESNTAQVLQPHGHLSPIGETGNVAWSPDGRWLLYYVGDVDPGDAGKTGYWLLRTSAMDEPPIHVGFYGGHAWSPDGLWLAFDSSIKGEEWAWILELETMNIFRIDDLPDIRVVQWDNLLRK
jgi:WD40 repeat protein